MQGSSSGWFSGLTLDTSLSPPLSPVQRLPLSGDGASAALWSQDECYRLEAKLNLARGNAGANSKVACPATAAHGEGRGEQDARSQRCIAFSDENMRPEKRLANTALQQIVKTRSMRKMGRIQDKLQEARRSSTVSAATGKAVPASSPLGDPLQDMWGIMGSLVASLSSPGSPAPRPVSGDIDLIPTMPSGNQAAARSPSIAEPAGPSFPSPASGPIHGGERSKGGGTTSPPFSAFSVSVPGAVHFGVDHKKMAGRERDRAIANERGGHTKGRTAMSWIAEQAPLDVTCRAGSGPSVPHAPPIAETARPRSELEARRKTIPGKVPANRGRAGTTIMPEDVPSPGAAAPDAWPQIAASSRREFTM